MVGTSRCDVPARVQRAERTARGVRFVPSPDASLGDGDGAARHPYQDNAWPQCNKPGRIGQNPWKMPAQVFEFQSAKAMN